MAYSLLPQSLHKCTSGNVSSSVKWIVLIVVIVVLILLVGLLAQIASRPSYRGMNQIDIGSLNRLCNEYELDSLRIETQMKLTVLAANKLASVPQREWRMQLRRMGDSELGIELIVSDIYLSTLYGASANSFVDALTPNDLAGVLHAISPRTIDTSLTIVYSKRIPGSSFFCVSVSKSDLLLKQVCARLSLLSTGNIQLARRVSALIDYMRANGLTSLLDQYKTDAGLANSGLYDADGDPIASNCNLDKCTFTRAKERLVASSYYDMASCDSGCLIRLLEANESSIYAYVM